MAKTPTDQKDENALRRAREARNLSQARAAEMSGVSRTMFSSWELGTREMTLRQLKRLKSGLGLSKREVDEIICWWPAEEES
jgi:transcriptional regulator with XRE-family HTH domain